MVIINFHYSYLPDYRGMNIPTWVIYNEEPYTGITWHYVNEDIDAGEIIRQKKIMLEGTETALQVVGSVMDAGKAVFEEFIDQFLEGPFKGKKNSGLVKHSYKRKELPQDGFIDLNDNLHQIIKMLRAYDYGPLSVIPKPKILIQDKVFTVPKYRVIIKDNVILGKYGWESNYTINKEDVQIDLCIKEGQ